MIVRHHEALWEVVEGRFGNRHVFTGYLVDKELEPIRHESGTFLVLSWEKEVTCVEQARRNGAI